MENEIFPESTCMICGEYCDTWEIIDEELWCYCHKCDIDTFHEKIIKDE